MKLRLFSMVLLPLLAMLLSPATVQAAPPWGALFPFTKVEADPEKAYKLTNEQGPWMVMAATFTGHGAEDDAHRLVLELRKRYKMPAYVYSRVYDLTKPTVGIGVNRYGGPKRMVHQRQSRYEEVAVLVGDFESVNDSKLQKTLKKLKYAKPQALDLKRDPGNSQSFAKHRYLQRLLNGDDAKQKKGPMGNAFATRNPLLPSEQQTQPSVDSFVINMNKNVKHSLLDCPGRYSVRVATFRGNVILDPKKIQAYERGTPLKSRLEEAADKAHRLTEALRSHNVEAYEFHDRHESVVTVGSFQSVGQKMPDGHIELQPAIHRIMRDYGASRKELPGMEQAGLQPKAVEGIPLDVQPIPVEVPRRSTRR